MVEFPDIFKFGFEQYKKKTDAIADAEIGWHLCQTGEKIPPLFKKGADYISEYVGEPVHRYNARKLWSKYKVREDRAARDLTQLQYAELFHVSRPTVKSWEGGHREPSWGMWLLITFSTEALQVAGRKKER